MVVVLGGRLLVGGLRRVVVGVVAVGGQRRHRHVLWRVVGMQSMEALEVQLQLVARTAALAAARLVRV